MRPTRRGMVLGLGATIAMLATMAAVTSQVSARAKGQINTLGKPGVAIKGYDPVAYFKEGRPRAGKKSFSLKHRGVQWWFSSAANKATFKADPAKYTPVYGGYCAYGVAQGSLVKIEPTAWSIKGGRLYLNYNASIQRAWSKNPSGYINKANARWPKLISRH